MKKILILLVVLAGIVGVTWYKKNERDKRLNRVADGKSKRELLFPDFDINGIRKVRIKDTTSEATMAVQKDSWIVMERAGFPAAKDKLQKALMSLKYEKVKAARRIGKDSWSKVGVNSPGDATATGTGTLVELMDEKGSLKHSFVLGGSVDSSGGTEDAMSMFGGGSQGNRFVRITGDDTIWEIGDQMTDLVPKPGDWISKKFIDIQKIKSVEVNTGKPEESWKATRETPEAPEFALEGAQPGQRIDTVKASLASLLSSPTFTDVLPKEKTAEIMKNPVKAKVVTFDGFTYDLQVAKRKEKDTDMYFISVAVSADLPKERPAVKDEKPEDKKKNDEEFAANKKKLEEKLAEEQALAGWLFNVSEYTVSTLLKKRSEILADPPTAPEAAAGAPAPVPGGLPAINNMIPGMPQVQSDTPAALVTPKSPLPSLPKPELKTEPQAPAIPSTPPTAAPAAPSNTPAATPEAAKPATEEAPKK